MNYDDFKTVRERTFNKDLNRDATPNGGDYVKFFSGDGKEKEVFLGGTCNDSTWREKLIPFLTIPYFNPVVKDWNDEARIAEEAAKIRCGFELYLITPKSTGLYSVAEAVKSAIINPRGTFVAFMLKDGKDKFNDSQVRSIDAILDLLSEFTINFLLIADDSELKLVADWINNTKRGFPDTLVMQMQAQPLKFAGVNGVQIYDLINLSKHMIQVYNDRKRSLHNMNTIKLLNQARNEQHLRTDDRKKRGVEGRDKE